MNDGGNVVSVVVMIKVINDPPKVSALSIPNFKIRVLEEQTYTINVVDETPFANLVYTLVSPTSLSSILTRTGNTIKFSPPASMST